MAKEKKSPYISEHRQTKVGGYLIREKRRSDMQRAIEQGLHFADAAEKAEIPYEIAISAVAKDEEFKNWYEISQDRPRLGNIKKNKKKQAPRTSLQIKSDFINRLNEVGLFDKIAVMAEQADPETEEGKQVLGFFMRYVVKDILPKETASKIEHSEGTSYDKMTDAELLEELQSRRAERLEYTQEIQQAEEARLSYSDKEVDDGEDRPGEDS